MLSRLLLKILFGPFSRTRVLYAERANRPGAFILAANHISHFDPPMLTCALRRKIDWMAMAELFEKPWSARYFRAVDAFPTDRSRVDRAAVKTALARLKEGRVVGMFPEGGIRAGRTSVLEGAPLRPGSAALAQMGDVPVVPCVLLGSDGFYAKSSWRPFWRVRVWIAFGEPIAAPAGVSKAESRRLVEEQLVETLRSLYGELRERFSLADADLPKTPAHRKGRE
jgi:1-acyl-sn-glycerol-3-phosphate acyltransferase